MNYQFPFDYRIEPSRLPQMIENKATSYKLFWLWGIFDVVESRAAHAHQGRGTSLIDKDNVLDFQDILMEMIINAWYPVIEYHLNLGTTDQLQHLVVKIHERYQWKSNILGKDLRHNLREMYKTPLKEQDQDLKHILAESRDLLKMVPYRLVSAFFKERTVGLKDQVKNRMIEELTKDKDYFDTVFYRIDTERKKVYLNIHWYEYIVANSGVLRGWLRAELIDYLQRRNLSVPAISMKLEAPMARNLAMASKLWTTVIEQHDLKDIYTGEPLGHTGIQQEKGGISIDHYIPWSFVMHDEFWNLLPTFKNVNSIKSNKLPDSQVYLKHMINQQYIAFNTIMGPHGSTRLKEEYLTVLPKMKELGSSGGYITSHEFINAMENTINPLYQIAKNQGFSVWRYDL